MDFTKTIIRLALMTSESIAHSASWAIDSELIRARGIIVNKPGGGGVLLEILGGGVSPVSPNPDHFSHQFSDLASKKLCQHLLD